MECVVRGYLFGSVYDEYNAKGTASGNKLPKGLRMAEILPEPIFTPSTKAETGHDENIDIPGFYAIVGEAVGNEIISQAIKMYQFAREKLEKLGIILADTKFEFGIDENNKIIVVDEVLTPDSSRYWEKESYKIGESPKSYDKQFVRDFLNSIKWNKQPPAPALPGDIILKTHDKYKQALDIIQKI